MPESESIGRKIVGIITDARGVCAAGHKVGDQFELSGYTSDGLCGYFYHDIFPYVVMLEFGGGFPEEYGICVGTVVPGPARGSRSRLHHDSTGGRHHRGLAQQR